MLKQWLKNNQKRLLAVVLLAALVVGITALGVTLISKDRQPHPTVLIPDSALQEEIPEETIARKASQASPGGVRTEANQNTGAAVQT